MRKTLGWLILMTTLFGMWLGQFALAYGITIQTMAPWAGFWFQPEPDKWERSLNDFFLFGPGSLLVALAVVLVSMAFFWRIAHREHRALFRYTFANVSFMMLVPAVYIPAQFINTIMIPTFPGDTPFPTYYTQILPVFSLLVLTLVWVVVLATVTSPDKRKRKQQAYDTLIGEAPVVLENETLAWDSELQTQQGSQL